MNAGRRVNATVLDEGVVNAVVGDFRRWMRSTLRTTAWLAVLSFASTAIVGTLLVVAQRSIQGGSGALAIPGFPLRFEADWLGSGLPVLTVALGAWMALSSLSHLAHAVVVRRHLRRRGASVSGVPGDAVSDDDDLDPALSGPGGFMAERLLLESYLSVVTSMTRALGLSLILVFLQPRQTAFGLVTCWLLVVGLGAQRFRLGVRSSVEFAAITRAVRAGQRAPEELIDVIYARDRRVTRLPLGQAFTATAAALLLVLLPLWVFTEPLPVAGLVLIVIWLPSLMAALTQAGPLGWRAAASFAPRPAASGSTAPEQQRAAIEGEAEDADAAPATRRVVVTSLPLTRWAGRTPLWVRAPGVNRTVVLVVDATGQVGPWSAAATVHHLARLEWVVLAMPADVAAGRALLPGEEGDQRLAGYLGDGPTLVLAGGRVSAEATSLAGRIKHARAVIFNSQLSDELDETVRVFPATDLDRLVRDGALAAALESWVRQ